MAEVDVFFAHMSPHVSCFCQTGSRAIARLTSARYSGRFPAWRWASPRHQWDRAVTASFGSAWMTVVESRTASG